MPSSVFFGFQHLNNNLICSVRTDTTHPDEEQSELIELAVVPLDQFLDIHKELLLFNLKMKPDRPEDIDFKFCRLKRAEVAEARIDKMKVADLFLDWYDRIGLPEGKKIIPLGSNYPVDRQRLINWLGYTLYSSVFSEDYRDVTVIANFLNDRKYVRGEPVIFAKQYLRWLAKQLHVANFEAGGSVRDDCRVIAEIYKKELKMMT